MKSIKYLLILLGFLFYATDCFSQSFYVSPLGNDNNNGSEETPWRTIQKSCSSATVGSTVFIKAGIYNEINVTMNVQGMPNNFITFRNYNNDIVTLKRTDAADYKKMIRILDKSYIRFQGLIFADFDYSIWGGGIFIEGNSHHIEIINCEFKNLNNRGSSIVFETPYGNHSYVLIKGNKFHDCYSPTYNPAIYMYTGHGDSIKIINNEIYNITCDSSTKAILVEGSDSLLSFKNMLIDSNKIHDCDVDRGEAISTSGNVEYFTISHNTIYNIDNIGIGIAGGYKVCRNPSKDFSRYFNIFENTVYNCREDSGRAAGIYLDGASYNIVERNLVYESNQGINIGCEHASWLANGNIIRDNNVHSCDRAGILIGEYNPNWGIVINCKVLNNTLFKNLDSGISVYEADFGCSRSTNCIFKNNIIYKSVRSYDTVRILISVQDSSVGNIFDYNMYYFPPGTNNVKIYYMGITFNTFSSYVTSTGQDVHSQYFNNPSLVDTNVKSLNLHLRSNSSAINSGDPGFIPDPNEVDIDRESRVYNGQVDCGSDEIQPSNIKNLNLNILPEKYSLSQNYPNPFNPTTNIEFSLPKKSFVKLKVFDINGKEISELVNENLSAGTFRYEFNAENLSSGLYFYKLETEKFSETKKMIVLK